MLGAVYAYAELAGLRYRPRPPWEIDMGVVDYGAVKESLYGPPELGFSRDIRDSPPDARVLNVAQWSDYWPASILGDFAAYMEERWGLTGVQVTWIPNVYRSNVTLLEWVLRDGRSFDVFFPTNHALEALEVAGHVVNLNRAWIPNVVNVFGPIPSPLPASRSELTYQPIYPSFPNGTNNWVEADMRTAAGSPFLFRGEYASPRRGDIVNWGEGNGLLGVPYQWGTTGLAYRTDILEPSDVDALGWDVLALATYTNPRSGATVDLTGKKALIWDLREAATVALKGAGWREQRARGLSPTPLPLNPDVPWNGEFQWSSNTTSGTELGAARDYFETFRSSLTTFGPSGLDSPLVTGAILVAHRWSVDAMYEVRPNSLALPPVDYLVPTQGATRWLDVGAVHRSSERLWLAHAFLDYLCDPRVAATVASWNVGATPNAWAFELMRKDPAFTVQGPLPDGTPYSWNPTLDPRIYADLAYGYAGPAILERCEFHRDLAAEAATYRSYFGLP